MYVVGIGNVTGCNKAYIFLNDEGKQSSKKATEDLLVDVFTQAEADCRFYCRMGADLRKEFEKRRDKVEERYHFITDEEVQEKYRASGYRGGIGLEVDQKVNNEECTRQYAAVYGFYDAVKYANERWVEADKLKRQAGSALREKF